MNTPSQTASLRLLEKRVERLENEDTDLVELARSQGENWALVLTVVEDVKNIQADTAVIHKSLDRVNGFVDKLEKLIKHASEVVEYVFKRAVPIMVVTATALILGEHLPQVTAVIGRIFK